MVNVHEINVLIERESDLYEPFNPKKELNGDIISYLERKTGDKSVGEKIRLHFISKEPVNEADVKQAFADWMAGAEKAYRKQKRTNMAKQAWMFCVGVVFIAASVLLQPRVNTVVFTVLSTIGAFAMWEAAAIWIVENPSARIRRHMLRWIAAGVEFRFDVDDSG